MDLWTLIGFVAVLALLAAVEKQLIAIHQDLVETKVKVEYISALLLKKDPPIVKLPEAKDHEPVV